MRFRYSENIGLLPRLARSPSDTREFDHRDVARLRFIRRAQAMNFTLAEVASLLDLRDQPGGSNRAVRDLARAKVGELSEHVVALQTLREELSTLVGACPGSGPQCSILSAIEGASDAAGDRPIRPH